MMPVYPCNALIARAPVLPNMVAVDRPDLEASERGVECVPKYGDSYSLIGGWGPFNFIDMCAALGIEPPLMTSDGL